MNLLISALREVLFYDLLKEVPGCTFFICFRPFGGSYAAGSVCTHVAAKITSKQQCKTRASGGGILPTTIASRLSQPAAKAGYWHSKASIKAGYPRCLYVLCNMSGTLLGSLYGKKHKGTWDITGISLELHWSYTGIALSMHWRCSE